MQKALVLNVATGIINRSSLRFIDEGDITIAGGPLVISGIGNAVLDTAVIPSGFIPVGRNSTHNVVTDSLFRWDYGNHRLILPRIIPSGYTDLSGNNALSISSIGANVNTGINIGDVVTGNRASYIDFHTDDTFTAYGLRILRFNTGPNTFSEIQHRGTGQLKITAADVGTIGLYTNGTELLRLTSAKQLVVDPSLDSGTIDANDSLHIKTGHGWNGLHIFQDRTTAGVAQNGHGFFFVAEPSVTFNSAIVSYNWRTNGASQSRAETGQGASYVRMTPGQIDLDVVDSSGVDYRAFSLTQSAMTGIFTDTGTTNRNYLTLAHNSTGTPAAGFGVGLQLNAGSSTTINQSAGTIEARWTVATHASRRSEMIFLTYDAASFRIPLQLGTSGAAAAIGFLGTAPVVQQTGGVKTAGATYNATAQSMIQIAYDALRTFGLIS